MSKKVYYIEVLRDGVVIQKREADGSDRLSFDEPATTFVCDGVEGAMELAGIILEGDAWARIRGTNIDIHLNAMW